MNNKIIALNKTLTEEEKTIIDSIVSELVNNIHNFSDRRFPKVLENEFMKIARDKGYFPLVSNKPYSHYREFVEYRSQSFATKLLEKFQADDSAKNLFIILTIIQRTPYTGNSSIGTQVLQTFKGKYSINTLYPIFLQIPQETRTGYLETLIKISQESYQLEKDAKDFRTKKLTYLEIQQVIQKRLQEIDYYFSLLQETTTD